MFILIVLLLLVVRFLSGPFSDMLLANAIGPEDLELPHMAYPMRVAAEPNQTIGGQGQGLDCSLPPGIGTVAFPRENGTAPIALRMRQACVFHDYCYRHGAATYGYSQADCDYMLQEQAFRLCTQINKSAHISQCETEARKVTLGVRVGGWGSFKRADADLTEFGSTYFEFDPYPLRSSLYRVIRVADAPAAWRSEGAAAKAYYIFRIKQSGTELRIVGIGGKKQGHCAMLALAARYDAITTPPLVARSRADRSDWLVWWRRASLTSTNGSFAGISPGTASLADWKLVFGAARTIQAPACNDNPFSSTHANAEKINTSPSAFTDLRPRGKNYDKDKPGEFVEKDTLISEFLPLDPALAPSRNNRPLVLYGITTHGCGKTDKQSTCLAEIEIDPASKEEPVLYEPYAANDTRCISGSKEADGIRGREGCDRYRNFNHAPFLLTRHGLPELVWIRRGNSAGKDYDSSAFLRRAPRRDSITGERDNFDTFALDSYAERLEPSASLGKTGEALISIVEEGWWWSRCLRLYRIEPRRITSDITEKAEVSTSRKAACIAGLDRHWLERPWQMLADGTMLFFHTALEQIDGREKDNPKSWNIWMRVAVVDPRAPDPSARITSENVIRTIRLCSRSSEAEKSDKNQSDAKFVLRMSTCTDASSTELARGRNITDMDRAAARVMRSTPIIVADMDQDGFPDIGVLPVTSSRMIYLRGLRDAKGIQWMPAGM